MNLLYDDLERGGLEFKILLNELAKKQASDNLVVVEKEKTKEERHNDLEEIENLMSSLKNVKTRVEKRRLLA